MLAYTSTDASKQALYSDKAGKWEYNLEADGDSKDTLPQGMTAVMTPA
jgi:hypothetical protein